MGSHRPSVSAEDRSRFALVTGASSGIGEAAARQLLRRGWCVVGVSRHRGALKGNGYRHLQVDLAHLAEVIERVEAECGPLVSAPHLERLCLVNSAADPALLGTVGRIDPVAQLRAYAVNVAAPTWLMGWLVRRSRRDVAIRIVNVSSGAGVAPFAGLGTYGGTKAALRMTGMVLASELEAARDVTILSYSPGPVDTPMQALARTSSRETLPIVDMFVRWHTEGTLSLPDEPASEIVRYVEGTGHPRFAEWRYGESGR